MVYTCIYCLRQLGTGAFNREHVLSQAFGTFEGSLVLHRAVCRDCNNYFANELELRFARGAFEGMLRYQRGMGTPKAGTLRIADVEIAVPEGSLWAGVRLTLTNEDTGLCYTLAAQAGFLDENSTRWLYFTLDDLDAGALEQHPAFKNKDAQIRIIGPSQQDHDAMISTLKAHGITFKRSGALQPCEELFGNPATLVEITFTINKGIRRCVAKYAFNYMAHVCGAAFAAGKDFDSIRRFIRFGETPPDPPRVVPTYEPILFDDKVEERQTDGHLLTLSWDSTLLNLVAQVSLFNHLTYRVTLCERFGHSIWRPVRSGHHFSLTGRSVKPLIGFSRDLSIERP